MQQLALRISTIAQEASDGIYTSNDAKPSSFLTKEGSTLARERRVTPFHAG